jgi:CRP/FNR family transcriptional regulator, cyclic AMP receptor protein
MKVLNNAQFVSELKKILFFKFINDGEIADVMKITEIIQFDAGEMIISEGDVQPYIFAVIKGTVNVLVREESGKEIFICAIGEGDVFGEAGIFLNVKRTANIKSTEDTILLRIQRNSFLGFIKSHLETGTKMLMLIIYSLIKKLRDANQEIAFERKSDISQDDIDSIISDFVYKQ